MDVVVGGQKISLNNTHFKAQGGEGSVYIKSGVAYKIYNDPKLMIPLGKISELGALSLPEIIKPLDVIYNSSQKPLGYTMRALKDTYVLCQLFNKAFKDRENISDDMLLKLISQLQTAVKHAHSKNILIVDLNEMNFLVNNQFDTLYSIDVDSYKTKSYPATAIMPSVEDLHAKRNWNENTDWYSFGIQACQLMIGIHPYKGQHPKAKTLDDRALQNISIFNKDVKLPQTAQSFNVIPKVLKDWLYAVFEEGKRIPPPDSYGAITIVATPQVQRVTGSDNFIISLLFDTLGDIVDVFSNTTITTQGVYVGNVLALPTSGKIHVAFTPSRNQPVALKIDDDKLRAFNVNKRQEIPISINAEAIMSSHGRVYIKQGEGIFELDIIELPANTIIKPNRVGSVLAEATQLFTGVAIQNLLGAPYASIFPTHGQCFQVKLDEIKGYRVIDAKYDSQVLILIGEKSGQYTRFIFRFSPDFTKHDVREVVDVSAYGPNFIVRDNGVVLHITDEDELELFGNHVNSSSVRVISDPAIGSDCRLFLDNQQVVFSKKNKLFKFNMK